MAAPLTYAEVSAAMGALLMLFVGLSLRELIALMRQILARQRECPTLYADRERTRPTRNFTTAWRISTCA